MDMAEVTAGGWTVEDVETFRMVTDHRPPRPHIYRKLFRSDARDWKVIALWVSGVVFSAGGVAAHRCLSLPIGALLLFVGVFCIVFWFASYWRVARDLRHGQTVVGVVEALEPYPLFRDYSTAKALTAVGGKVSLVLLPRLTRLVKEILAAGGRAEVFFVHSRWSEFSLVLAARPVHEELGDGPVSPEHQGSIRGRFRGGSAMADPSDETGFADARADSESRTVPGRHLEAPLDDEDIAQRVVRRTGFPGFILAAGVLWILGGTAYIALFVASRLLGTPFQWSDLWLILGAAFFIKDGVQLIRGRRRDPLVESLLTIVIGLCFFSQADYQVNRPDDILALAIPVFLGSIFLIPGALALLGRNDYLAWKEGQAK
jgi:hypothetical protein